ncbi:DUF6356 family protein [Aurantiacibacter gangjinensis]|uniref:Capsule biosynthesis protein n=1 Tax=Aurantiacibacter gangjinensis TaxID=502682 RepID=A0A0G9MMT8_9SPHN|nr:DUF6356 family protein [Aurantiacibacter gangjinensis]APE28086.1 Type 1 capsular polysaccharide biosynthesis protein J [Aurantiacibacter gangjinensis]KLE32010.1 capsule biosynthesis protein [Aurantiacibacter gangjinensis]
MLRNAFTAHPASVGESYGEHLVTASRFAFRLIAAGLACLVHAIFPFMFIKTGSRQIEGLHKSMVSHRSRTPTGWDYVI